mmetsp:Transcript_39802/g.112929  ORF Transcript_39802/g.112929 Transcript_39802/m.112929 type:complete len:455 (-) Transcript_39802:167-1531(-)|eukprot:CAMPEP_0117657242 /NCGR_PEP_ID=MMETSP0804-20121206/5226_1 /TAXON_ID=1074897 /ORGANISM="Tetraselmis astigmatica, Strain CCMP880" /LENGTH=454 /DNA_ID=CAMNT_0005463683 /DNA_START=151 /DNA_END=1515 /DNA_ORIENTATION=-
MAPEGESTTSHGGLSVATESSSKLIDNLNFIYPTKTLSSNFPGGWKDRHQKSRKAAKLARSLFDESKPCVFGSAQPRLKIHTEAKPMHIRIPGTTDWSNGTVVGMYDSLWGRREVLPDTLDIAGSYKAAKPGEDPKQALYMEVKLPLKAALWSRTSEPRLASAPKKPYRKELECTVDPYDVVNKERNWKEHRTLSASRNIRSATFADRRARADISSQSHFDSLHMKVSTVRAIPNNGPEHRPTSASAAWKATTSSLDFQYEDRGKAFDTTAGKFFRQERFNQISGKDEFLATSKGNLSIAPPPTKFNPADPVRPTVQAAARTLQSARPGYRGGLFRASTSGTYAFISNEERMKVLRTASVQGVGPQTYADGSLRNSIAHRAQSASNIQQRKQGETEGYDEGTLQGRLGSRRSFSAQAATAYARNTKHDSVRNYPKSTASRLITDELLSDWARKC